MYHYIRQFFVLCLLGIGVCQAQTPTARDISRPENAIPPNIVTTSNKPMMMLVASKDHTLFGPVYTDFEDLDEDGVIDTTFKPTFKYYGYFDATKCYSYSASSGGLFSPVVAATVTGDKRWTCPATQSLWSGNFLNWVTTTRLDTVRKMLYGGFRDVDAVGNTVLMGSRLVLDAHSFVKYYNGTDIRDYTPFTTAELTKTIGPNSGRYAGISICVTGSTDDPAGSIPQMRLVKGNARFWSTVEILLCRWRDSPDNYDKGTFGPKLARFYSDPLTGNGGILHEISIPSRASDGATYAGIGPDLNVRVKVCDPALLGEERCQAYPASSTTNYKPYGILQEFGSAATASSPAKVEFGLITGSYDRNQTAGALRKNIRDLADEINPANGVFCHKPSSGCAATLADGRATGNGAIKTFDNIQLFGRNGANTNYGNGRKPSESNEGDLPAWGNPIGEMLVQALQYYAYDGSTTSGTPGPSNPPSPNTNDAMAGLPVANWSDPLAADAARDQYGIGMCRPLNILALSSGALTFDGQAGTPFTTLPNRRGDLDTYVNSIGDAENITNTLRSVGSVTGKGLTAADDKNSCAAKKVTSLSNVNGVCPDAPALGGTYQVAGAALYGNTTKIRNPINPPADLPKIERALKVRTLAASLSGGAARIDIPIPGTNPPRYVYITPESVQNGGVVSAPLTFASISSGPMYGAFMVTWNDILMGGDYDMDITGFLRYDIRPNPSSPYGYEIEVTTDITNVCGGAPGTHGFSIIGVERGGVSANGRYLTHQHAGDKDRYLLLDGMPRVSEYLCGDAEYLNRNILVGGELKKYRDTVCFVTGDGGTGDPNNQTKNKYCTVRNQDYLVKMSFDMVGEVDALIKEPLYYAAKYGAFKSSRRNADGTFTDLTLPPDASSWDLERSDGSVGSDGVPDGYFLARRPDILEAQLRRALDLVATDSNASPAVIGQDFTADDLKFTPKFDSIKVSGAIEAYQLDAEGYFETTPRWEAGNKLYTQHSSSGGNFRRIITNSGNGSAAGVAFRWDSLPSAFKTQMTTASTNVLTAANAQLVVNYIRGDQSREGPAGLRERGENLLGPIVNASPFVQSPPSGIFQGLSGLGYRNFLTTHKNREKLLWVAANDGMLHAFRPADGSEAFAYVPGVLANRLAEIPLQRGTGGRTKINNVNFVQGTRETPASDTSSVWPYVDGSPFVADVKVGDTWKSYLFGALGRGGKAIYALDVTDPSLLTEANAAEIFKWQFTAANDPDLGYIVGDFLKHPATNQSSAIAALNDNYPPPSATEKPRPRFALLLGNGHKSRDGKAVLFIIYIDGPLATGSWSGRYKKIILDAGPNNGLSTPRWEDIDGNGTADVVYAGDLKGNLWKVDISGSNPDAWGSAYKVNGVNAPLYQATWISGTPASPVVTPLPITSAPQVLFMGQGGMMVNFATGNAFDSGTFPNRSITQRVYGIWDRPGMGTVGGRTLPRGVATLAQRTLLRSAVSGLVTSASGSQLNWSQQDGWYFNLPTAGEAVLSDPSLNAGLLSFVGVRPKATTDNCNNAPVAALYLLDPISGFAERNTLGTVQIEGVTANILAKDVPDQKIRVVSDRSKRKDTKSCRPGDPGCTCTDSTCVKEAAACRPGQKALRATGQSADELICYNTSPRLHWREIPGIRTDR